MTATLKQSRWGKENRSESGEFGPKGAKGGKDLTQSSEATSGLASVPALLQRNAREFANKAAYREKEFGIWQSWTWAETAQEIEALALGLLKLGINEGDFIAVSGRNRPHFYWSMVAAQMVGAIPVPVYSDSAAEEMAYVLDHCGARFAVVQDQEQVDKIIDVQGDLTEFEHMIYIDPRGLRKYDHTAVHQYKQVQKDGRAAHGELIAELKARREKLTYDSICVMLYTSGTTGRPKGVRIPLPEDPAIDQTNSLVALAMGLFRFTPDSVYLSPAPLYHAAPLRWSMTVHKIGGTVVMMKKFDAENALAAIEKYKATCSQWVPTHFVRMLKLPEEVRHTYDLSTLNCAIHAAAPCPMWQS